MFIPVGTDRPLSRRPVVTIAVVGLLVVLHLVRMLLGSGGRGEDLMLQWMSLGRFESDFWRFLTYALLHGDFWHLAGNCLFLWVFGQNVEDRFGRVWFVMFLIGGAAISGLAHVISTPVGVIGASGAVSGVTGAYFVLFPRTRIKTIILFIMIGVTMVPAWFFIGLAVARDMLSELLGLDTGIAHIAHLAGYLFGGLVCASLLKFKVLEPEVYDLMTTIRQRQRRSELRAATKGQTLTVSVDARPARRSQSEQRAFEARRLIAQHAAHGRMDEALHLIETQRVSIEPEDLGALKALTPGRDVLLGLAQAAVEGNQRSLGVWLYERMLAVYPQDREAGSARVMAGLLLIRDLNEPERGAEILRAGLTKLTDEERSLAEQLIAESGVLATEEGQDP